MIDLDDYNADELLCLRDNIDSFLNASDLRDRAYCEGWEEFEDLHADTIKAAAKLQKRIKGLAIALGIQAEFLKQYAELEQRYKSVA